MARYSTPPAPAGASPEIAAIWRDYFRADARGSRYDVTDAALDAAGKAMEAAAERLANALHSSPHDLAAKARFVMAAQDDSGGLSTAEHAVRMSLLEAVVAMARGEDMLLGRAVAPREVNQLPMLCMANVALQ